MSKQRELLSSNRTLLMIWAAFFVTLAVLVPTIFHAVGGLGKVFLPMHIPVILCGFICGPFSIQESAAGGLSYKVKKLNGLDWRVLDTFSRRFLAVVSPKAFSSTLLA